MPQTRIGDYRVRAGNANVPFWRLVPGTHVFPLLLNTQVAQIAPNDPTTFNTVTLPPRFGIFDIVVRMSEPVIEQQLTDAQSTDLLVTSLAGPPPRTSMPMWEDGSGTAEHRVANFSFAVRLPRGQQHFEGTLVLTAERTGAGGAGVKTVRLPLRVNEFQREADLFVFFIATRRGGPPKEPYCWIHLPVTTWTAPNTGTPLSGARVDLKVLRDYTSNDLNRRNRRVALVSDAAGNAAFQHSSGARTTVAVPTEWPLICTAEVTNAVPRAHLARLEPADIDHNQNPHALTPIRVIPVAAARTQMNSKTVLVDPGHGVVYAFTSKRRSQEWFVAHRIGTQVVELLRNRFGMPAANIFMTRTAGFGLIDPDDINRRDAPERGANRFLFDLAGRRVRTRQVALGLHDVSDLVLTGDDHTPANVSTADRDRLVLINATTIAAIVARMQNGLPHGHRIQPSSVRWHPATSRYVCRIERHPPVAGANPIVNDVRNVEITAADWFTLDATMLSRLADRTALWSIELELGSGPGANAATGRPSFADAERAAMQAHAARDYIQQKIVAELDLEEPYVAGATVPNDYRNKETKGWHIQMRRDYINRKNCDIALTIHENADGPSAFGTAMLVGQGPPANQVRAAKAFMKYVDPFDQGVKNGGVVENDAGLLAAGNTRRAKHVYFELEFMTATIPENPEVRAADPSKYQYQVMVEDTFVNTAAEQIVAGVVEFLVDPQSDLDTVTYDSSNLPTW